MSRADPQGLLPPPIAAVLARLPQWPPAAALALALNAGIASRVDASALARITHKVIRIRVRDAGVAVALCFDGRRFVPRSAGVLADVTITASARDYLRLAARREDPDTLFFARRLVMDGDTETGLIVKNMLDALDLEPLLSRLERPRRLFESLHALLPGGERQTREHRRAPPR